jgi:hypothetical protein
MFKLLSEKQIRARVIGKDMTGSTHWVNYFRPDGVLLSSEMDRKWTGTWKFETTNSACRTQIWKRSAAMKSGCPART